MVLIDADFRLSTVFVFGTFGMLILFSIAAMIFFYFDIQEKRREVGQDVKRLRSHFQDEILNAQLAIEEKTMRKLALEIHDNVGQILTLAKINLSTINVFSDKDQERKIADSRDLIGKSISDLRTLSKTLGNDFVEAGGFKDGTQRLLSSIEKLGIVKTQLICSHDDISLDLTKELILFRIVQECLNNVMKHSEATDVEVNIKKDANKLTVTVLDNGKGIQPEGHRSGSGLSNMRKRAEMIGGSMVIGRNGEIGTQVMVTIPILNNRTKSL